MPIRCLHFIPICLILPAILLPVYPQTVPKAVVRGLVVDDSTRAPLSIANVFISNSTLGTATDAAGKFEIRGIPLGTQQLVASLVGYQPGVRTVQLRDSATIEVEFRLKPKPVQLAGVEVQAADPVEWRKKLEKFTKEFVGSDDNAEACKILNAEVLDFPQESDPLVASAREALEIENKALGYHIRCVLIHFAASGQTMQYIVLTSFRNLKPRDATEAAAWNANRLNTYRGSMQHFFRSVLQGKTKTEGFDISAVKRNFAREAMTRPAGFEVKPDTLLKPGEFAFQSKLYFPELLQVVYRPEDQISLLEMNRPFVVIYPNGQPGDPLAFWTYGYWSHSRMADMLPIDFEPQEGPSKGR